MFPLFLMLNWKAVILPYFCITQAKADSYYIKY